MDEEDRSEDNYITSFSDRSTSSYRSDCYGPCCEWEEFPSPSWRSMSTGSPSDILSRSNSKAQKWPLDILAKELQELSTTREEVLTKFDLKMSKGMLNKYQIHHVRSWLLQIDQTTALVNTFDSSSLQKKEILSMFPWRKNKGVPTLRRSIMDLKGHGEQLLCGFDVTPRLVLEQQQKIGILSFEVAKTMTRLVSLHRSLTESELVKLHGSMVRSQRIAYFNSTDHLHLLRVTYAELVDDLDHAAASIARLSGRFQVKWPRGFDLIYADLKSGRGTDFELGFPSKDLDKYVKKMAGHVSATYALHREIEALADLENKIKKTEGHILDTSPLHREMEALADVEASKRNLELWRNFSDPITVRGLSAVIGNSQANPPRANLLKKKLAAQQRAVAKLKRDSLWSQTYEKVADLMSRSVVTLFARVCSVFSLIIIDLPLVVFERDGRYRFAVNSLCYNPHQQERPTPAGSASFRNLGPILRPTVPEEEVKSLTVNYLDPPSGTVGEAGLALRYAEVVVLAEEMMFSPESAGEDARDKLYQMLPNGLRMAAIAKLTQWMRVDTKVGDDKRMTAGWKVAARRILQWLGPMAHDTVLWHAERSYEQQRTEPAPKVLLLQTLHLADREKAEAAIVAVLAGLSRVCMDHRSAVPTFRVPWPQRRMQRGPLWGWPPKDPLPRWFNWKGITMERRQQYN